MCGFAGFKNFNNFSANSACDIAKQMALQIKHRGPDDAGVWLDEHAGIALAHRRLAIVDLSSAGHQPMISNNGRSIIVFNGEIYNHLELRQELENSQPGVTWRGHSDTETLLAAIEAWGIEKTLEKTVGMFAFALWDRKHSILTLARDRLGEKPLYYGWSGKTFLFASELKALRVYPGFTAEIERDVLTLLVRYNYIPSPYSIYKNIYKLPPGSYLTFVNQQIGHIPKPITYWSALDIAESAKKQPFSGTVVEAKNTLEQLLQRSVSGQMMSDVPLGAFLSGGVDSSTIVALMQAQSNRPVKTFTIGFPIDTYNEAPHAKAVAQHLGTDHTELYLTPQDALEVIPRLPHLYDEPFADSSQIPTYLVSQLTRQQVTVSLSGDGADELFGGYYRYIYAAEVWRTMSWQPLWLRTIFKRLLTALPPARWDVILQAIGQYLPKHLQFSEPGLKLHKLARVLSSSCADEIYQEMTFTWKDPTAVVLHAQEPSTILMDRTTWPNLSDFGERMMAMDTVSYLPDDILVKVDRAAMATSLETRVPYLDHRLLEFAWQLPAQMKIRNGQSKWLLRQVLYKYVPKELIERPKMGFGVPIDHWLRGPLRDWAEALLDEKRLIQQGYFNPQPIHEKWREHLTGQRDWQYWLWSILMFQSWLESTT